MSGSPQSRTATKHSRKSRGRRDKREKRDKWGRWKSSAMRHKRHKVGGGGWGGWLTVSETAVDANDPNKIRPLASGFASSAKSARKPVGSINATQVGLDNHGVGINPRPFGFNAKIGGVHEKS